jgi:hypothetical protein
VAGWEDGAVAGRVIGAAEAGGLGVALAVGGSGLPATLSLWGRHRGICWVLW